MDKLKMKQIVLNYIFRNREVTFVEIERLFEANEFEYRGNMDQVVSGNTNVVFWAGWNGEALDIVLDLEREGRIHREPAPTMLYMMDGKCLALPLVKSTRIYKTAHWLPVVYCVGDRPVK